MASITALNFSFGTGSILMPLVNEFVDLGFVCTLCEKRDSGDHQEGKNNLFHSDCFLSKDRKSFVGDRLLLVPDRSAL